MATKVLEGLGVTIQRLTEHTVIISGNLAAERDTLASEAINVPSRFLMTQ